MKDSERLHLSCVRLSQLLMLHHRRQHTPRRPCFGCRYLEDALRSGHMWSTSPSAPRQEPHPAAPCHPLLHVARVTEQRRDQKKYNALDPDPPEIRMACVVQTSTSTAAGCKMKDTCRPGSSIRLDLAGSVCRRRFLQSCVFARRLSWSPASTTSRSEPQLGRHGVAARCSRSRYDRVTSAEAHTPSRWPVRPRLSATNRIEHCRGRNHRNGSFRRLISVVRLHAKIQDF